MSVKFIEFHTRLINVDRVLYFNLDCNVISCCYTAVEEMEISYEDYDTEQEAENRYDSLKKILGITYVGN